MTISQDIIIKYLEQCLGDWFEYSFEDTKTVGGKPCQFTFVFQDLNQGREAEQLLRKNAKRSGEKIEFHLLMVDTVVDKCKEQVQRKGKMMTEQHRKKINEITRRLASLRVRKHVSLDEFDKILSKRKALEQKKDELEKQQEEFERFSCEVIAKLSAQNGKPLSSIKKIVTDVMNSFGRECHRLDAALPMYAKKSRIIDTIKENQVCVVLGETGSGKSTQMTQYLYEAGFAKKGVIVCTQPRKVAATSLAAHVAREMGGVTGQIVGCHVGGKIQANRTTSIVYATDHVLLNECLKDPNLSKYSCIIIDEAHERSLYSDLLLGMIKKALTRRPELRLVITSATIDPETFVTYFDQCPVLKVSGRMFPVDVIWTDDASNSSENYVQAAVDAARKIHHREGSGDILVFLTSPVETERACENLAKVEPDSNLVCLPLHGKLRQEEQAKVFSVDMKKRKVVFATNCAETSITIPGIRYVVDTGMVKEMKYDPKRNKRSLEVTTISKSSAEQRKGRAGRTQAGKCYRLYSQEEYSAMEDGSKPEILRVHLGQAVLKLMELGIEDVSQFDFVESPSPESIQQALEALKCLGALENGKLTELGRKIARVPVEPRLARMIFDGIDQGIGAEAVMLAAISTVSGSVFFRMGSEEEKQLADSRKVGFCHNGGDLLTLLEVYRKYLEQPERKRNQWAFNNSLNAKSLRMTGETVKELKLALKHELNMTVPDTVQQNDGIDLKLQRILISCYAANLCVFTGHEKAGYTVASSNHCVQLHPSSALKFLGTTPQFIVFEQLLKTSRDFVINATPVQESWLREMIAEGAVNHDMCDLTSTVMTQASVPCSPDLMILAFGGFRKRLLDQVEEEVSKSCDDCLVVLERDEKSGQMKVFVPPKHTGRALFVVESHLERSRRLLRCEDREEYLKQDCQGLRIVWGTGGEIQEVLMPHMYRTVTVSDIQDEQMVLDCLKSYGDIVKHQLKQKDDKSRMYVTFKKSEEACKAVKSFSDDYPDSGLRVQASHVMFDGKSAQVPQFKVKAKWLRRLCKGTGSIEFVNDMDYYHTLGSLHSMVVKTRKVILQADRHRPEQIFIRGLDSETSEKDVKTAIETRLPTVNVKKVFLHREPEFETTDETVELQKKFLEDDLGIFATSKRFSIYVRKPSPKDYDGFAYLTFEDSEEGQAALRGGERRNIPGLGIVTLQPNLSTTLLCPRNVFTVIEAELKERLNEFEHAFNENLVKVKDKDKTKRVAVEVRSDCTDHFIRATAILSEILNGDEIDCKINKNLDILLTNPVKDVLQTIQKETGTVINQDWKNKVVRIYGREANRESAKLAINKFLDDTITSNSHLWQIQLRGPNKPRGLLKSLFVKFGEDLQGIKNIPGVQKVHVDFRFHVLKIISSEEAQETINCIVTECCDSLPQQGENHSEDQIQLICGICLCDLDAAADIYRLACCGHAYDRSCIILQLKSAEVPLKCVKENCEEPVTWRDLQNLLNQSERKKLALSALDAYARGNSEIVKYCPTTDCGMVYRVSTDGRLHKCGACLVEICTSCHVQYHSGLTCAMFKSEKKVEGCVKEWMMEDPSNRKNCPKCNTTIEKNAGCNHMECSQCKCHMCWMCLRVFATSGEVYDHQRDCPRNTSV